jgi:hypothetical protein
LGAIGAGQHAGGAGFPAGVWWNKLISWAVAVGSRLDRCFHHEGAQQTNGVIGSMRVKANSFIACGRDHRAAKITGGTRRISKKG